MLRTIQRTPIVYTAKLPHKLVTEMRDIINILPLANDPVNNFRRRMVGRVGCNITKLHIADSLDPRSSNTDEETGEQIYVYDIDVQLATRRPIREYADYIQSPPAFVHNFSVIPEMVRNAMVYGIENEYFTRNQTYDIHYHVIRDTITTQEEGFQKDWSFKPIDIAPDFEPLVVVPGTTFELQNIYPPELMISNVDTNGATFIGTYGEMATIGKMMIISANNHTQSTGEYILNTSGQYNFSRYLRGLEDYSPFTRTFIALEIGVDK
jgi:hypothetical protein